MKKNLLNQQNTKKLYQQLLLLLILFFSGNVWGQISITSTSAVTQNFNTITTGSSLPANWRIHASTTSPVWSSGSSSTTVAYTNSGTPTAGGTYIWGNSAGTDTAIGAMTSGGFASPNNLMAFYSNNTGSPISQLSISYNAKRYRINTALASVSFSYSLDGSSWTAVSAGDISSSTIGTGSSSYTFASPAIFPVSSFNITGLNISNGSNFYLRWNINTTGSSSQAISIDNVSVTATTASLSPCNTPVSQPSSLTFGTTSASTINATFTGVASPNTPSGYLILRSISATAPTLANGTSYATNTDVTIGSVVYRVLQGSVTAFLGTTIAETGLASNTKYYYYIYSFNNNCTGQPYYLTSSPLTGNKITCPSPATNAASTVTNTGVSVSWAAAAVGGSAETIKYRFELYSDSGRTTPVAGYPLTDATSPVSITGLTSNTTYFYRIVAYNSSCQSTNLDGSFYNGVCVPGTTSNTSHYISNFTTTKGYSTNINKTSTYVPSGYQDNYATDKVEMYPTGSFDFSYTTVGSQLGTSIWIDWNNDWVFDTSERVFTTTATGTAGGNGTITVPTGKALGDYRMRVRTERYASSPDNPCSSAFTAETEDYKISVVAQPDYVIYTDATTVNNTVNNTLNIYFKDFDGYNNFYTNDQLEIWMHAGIKTSSAIWQYQNAGQDFNNTSTLIKFTRESTNPNVYKATVKLADWFCIPTGTTVEGLNLVFRNQYGVGGNNQTADMLLNLTSSAVAVNVSTIGTASAVTTNSATISWTAPTTGAVRGFDYYYSASNTPPTSGTTPSGTVAGNIYTANLSSLSPATTYYFWVRTKGCDTNSAWSASGNFTTACVNITTFPWVENFDSMSTLGANVVPNCWMTTSGSQSWTSSNAVASTSSPGANSPSNYMRLQWNNSSASNLYTPGFTLNAGKSYDFTFYYRTSTTGSNGGGFNGDLYVNSEQSSTGSTFLGNFVTSTQNVGYTMYKYTFTPTTTGTFYFNLRATSNNATATYYLGIDDFRLEETPPTLLANNASTASLVFSDQAITTTSATQSFNLSGLMLTGAPGNITISAPAGFEVSSVDNTTWGTSTTVSYTSATLADKQVNVRFKPTDCTSISNAVLTINGGGATVIPTVTLSGKGIIPAPTAIAGTDSTATTFTANWQPVAGATGYELDVYKKGELLTTATEGFESGMTMTSYVTGVGNFDLGTGTWAMNRVIRSTTAANNYNSSASGAQLEGGSSSSVISPSYNKLKTLKFHARRGSSATTISVYKVVSGVETLLGTQVLANSSPSQYTFDVNETSNDVKIKIVNGSAVAYIDNVIIDYYAITNEYVTNYNSKVIVGNSVNSDIVIGLSPNTTYNYVVRAISSSCESVNSNEITVTTNNIVVWNGSSWSNGDGPTATLDSKITGAYNIPISFETNNLEITSTGSLEIKAQKDVTVYGVITLPADDKIVVDSDANLVQKNTGADTNSSNTITVKRTALQPTKGYTFWSSPVTNQNLYSFSSGYNPANGGTGTGTPWNRFFVYKESSDTFVTNVAGEITLGSLSVFETGRAYAIRGKNSYTPTGGTGVEIPAAADEFNFKGKMHNASLSSQPLRNSCGSTGLEANCTKGYNLIGNPYPSNLDFDALHAANNNKIYGTAYFWTNNDIAATASQAGSNYTGNNYAIYNLTGGTPAVEVDPRQGVGANPIPNGTVKVGQGFIVKAKKIAAGSPVEFTNAMRVGYDADAHFYNAKKAEKNRFWLKMTAPSNIANTVLIGYIPGATNGFEIDYDGELFVIGSDAFYSILPSKKLAIQGKEDFTTEDVVSLGTKHAVSGTYNISLSKKEGLFLENQKIFLRDKLTETYTDLTIMDYSFSADQGIDDNRFEIVYQETEVLAAEDSDKHDFLVYRDGINFVVKSSHNLGKVELYDATGKLVQSRYSSNKEVKLDSSVLVSGVYIIKAENSGNVRTKKIIK